MYLNKDEERLSKFLLKVILFEDNAKVFFWRGNVSFFLVFVRIFFFSYYFND